jgi:hypothetical protein
MGGSRDLQTCPFRRASICLDFTTEAGLIKHPIAHSTGQSRHYTIDLISTRGVRRKMAQWDRMAPSAGNKSVQFERHNITVRHAMVPRLSRHASLAYTFPTNSNLVLKILYDRSYWRSYHSIPNKTKKPTINPDLPPLRYLALIYHWR